MMGSHGKEYGEASLALTVSGATGLLAGVALGLMTGVFEVVPGLMVLIPPAIGMRGNIFGALGSRMGTAMHTGVFSTSLERRGEVAQNVYASLLLTVVGSVALGYVAEALSVAFGVKSVGLAGFVLISLVGGLLSGVVLVAATVVIAFLGFRRGWDIDNTSAPLVTAIGDFVTIPALYVAALLYLSTPKWGVDLSLLVFSAAALGLFLWARRSDQRSTRRIVLESTPPLLVASVVNALAGLALESRLETLVAAPALLVLIPPFLEEAGALGGVLSSRLSSKVHTGLMEASLNPADAMGEFKMTLLLAVYVFPLVGALSHLASVSLGLASPSLVEMVEISVVAGFGTMLVVCAASFLVSVLSFRRGLDPDNYAIPLVTSVVDVVGVVFLMVAVMAF